LSDAAVRHQISRWSEALWLEEQEAYAANDEIGGALLGSGLKQDYRVCEAVGTEDETIRFEIEVANEQRTGVVNGIERWPRRLVPHQRVVVPIDDGDRVRREDGLHGNGVGGGKANGDEAKPILAGVCAAGAKGLEDAGGDAEEIVDGVRRNVVTVERGCDGDQGHCVVFGLCEGSAMGGKKLIRQKIGDCEELRLEDFVESFEAESSLPAEEVRDVRLPESGLLREHRAGEDTAIDPTYEF
jgi:hypothetical protein